VFNILTQLRHCVYRDRFAASSYLSLHHLFQTGSEADPVSYPVATGSFFPLGKCGQSVNLPQSSSVVKNAWSYKFTSPYAVKITLRSLYLPNPHLVPRSRISRSCTSSSPSPSTACSGAALLYYYRGVCVTDKSRHRFDVQKHKWDSHWNQMSDNQSFESSRLCSTNFIIVHCLRFVEKCLKV
jgi:hypothetical protein